MTREQFPQDNGTRDPSQDCEYFELCEAFSHTLRTISDDWQRLHAVLDELKSGQASLASEQGAIKGQVVELREMLAEGLETAVRRAEITGCFTSKQIMREAELSKFERDAKRRWSILRPILIAAILAVGGVASSALHAWVAHH